MRNNRLEEITNRMDRVVDAIRLQLEDLNDEQLLKIQNLVTFELMDRQKDLEELTKDEKREE